MDAPIDLGHVHLMQREIMRDHEQIVEKCAQIQKEYEHTLELNIREVNKMRAELKKRQEVYLELIENKCFRFLKSKLSAIHEEIERKKQAIALHEKKRENYLNHAKESLKNEQNMRKGVALVNETYHKYLRQLTKSKVEYAVIDERLQSDEFYALQEKLNDLRNKNDRYWYWYKKEKEIYKKSIKSFDRFNRFFKEIEKFLIGEYSEESREFMLFKHEYYEKVLRPNVDAEALRNPYNKEIFAKKKISDIELVYNMKKKDIKLPASDKSVINRLYKNMKPEKYEMRGDMSKDEAVLFERSNVGGNEFVESGSSVNDHYNSSEDELNGNEQKNEAMDEYEDAVTNNYIKTDDNEIFGGMGNEEEPSIEEQASESEEDAGDMEEFIQNVTNANSTRLSAKYSDEYNDESHDESEENESDLEYEDVMPSETRKSDKFQEFDPNSAIVSSIVTKYKKAEDSKEEKDEKPEQEKKRRKKWKSQDFDNDPAYYEDYRKGSLITPVGKVPKTNPSWDGTITSTSFYGNKHQQLDESNEMEFETFEPSANYHDDDDEDNDDPNRPSSTIFTPMEDRDDEQVFFPPPPAHESDVDEEDSESEYDGSEDDGFGPRMSVVRNIKKKERTQKQNSISVSGHHGQGLIDDYDDGIVPPDDDEDYDDSYGDDEDNNGAFGGGGRNSDDDENVQPNENDDQYGDDGGYGSMVDSGDDDEDSSYMGTESD